MRKIVFHIPCMSRYGALTQERLVRLHSIDNALDFE